MRRDRARADGRGFDLDAECNSGAVGRAVTSAEAAREWADACEIYDAVSMGKLNYLAGRHQMAVRLAIHARRDTYKWERRKGAEAADLLRRVADSLEAGSAAAIVEDW